MDFTTNITTLPSGLKLLTCNLPQSLSTTALLMVKVGSRYESDRLAGLSHFLEHLVFKGTKKYPTTLKLATVVDSVGAEFNAFTSKEYTGFYVKADSQHLPLALDVLSQLIIAPLFPKEEIKREKGVIVEEINMYEDTPMAKIGEVFEALIYGKTALGRQIIGFKETVTKVKQKDFIAYRRQWYKPERMVLGIVGRIKNYELGFMNSVNQYFSFPSADKSTTAVSPINQPQKENYNQQVPQLKIRYKKTEQAHFCLGVRAFPRGHPSRYTMAVLATILGGNMSSRLFTEVREKRGLAYYIKTDLSTYFDNGFLVTQAGVDLNKIHDAIKVVLSEYQKVGKAGKVTQVEKELKNAKEYLKGKLALSLEDTHEVASFFVEDLVKENKIRQVKEVIKGIEAVTIKDLARVARKIFVNQGLNLAVIGPYQNEARFAKLLKL